MKAILTKNYNETKLIFSMDQLMDELILIQKQKPQIVLLEFPKFGQITLGVSKELCFLEFDQENCDPPYLIAVQRPINTENVFFEFDACGTPTPVKLENCISFDYLKNILEFVFTYEKFPENIEWKEI